MMDRNRLRGTAESGGFMGTKTTSRLNRQAERTQKLTHKHVRQIRRMDIYHHHLPSSIVLTGPFMPVVGCYDVPVAGGFHWAVALGKTVATEAIVPSVPVSRFIFTEPADRRYRWVYEADWSNRSDELKRRCGQLAGLMADTLEQEVERVVGHGLFIYNAAARLPIEVWPFRQVRPGGQVGNIDLVLRAFVVAVRWV